MIKNIALIACRVQKKNRLLDSSMILYGAALAILDYEKKNNDDGGITWE